MYVKYVGWLLVQFTMHTHNVFRHVIRTFSHVQKEVQKSTDDAFGKIMGKLCVVLATYSMNL